MFRIRRNDTDILVISNKYVGELKALPSTRLNATQALVQVSASVVVVGSSLRG